MSSRRGGWHGGRTLGAIFALLSTTACAFPGLAGESQEHFGSGPTASDSSIVIGDTCASDDPTKLCLAIRYVAYRNSSGAPVISQAQAVTNIRKINNVWSQCNIGFQIEEFDALNPADDGLQFDTANYPELDDIRGKLDEQDRLLIVTTGPWNRTGTLGSTAANAWTAMPGSGPYGAVLESPVGTYSNIIAHELGHYLNLDHVSNAADLMNPVIYDTSTVLNPSQCATARNTANGFWSGMLRRA